MPDSVAAEIGDTGTPLLAEPEAPLDMAHVFHTDRAALTDDLKLLRDRLAPGGILWVSWPKRAAKVPTDIGEQDIRDLALPLGLVDTKVCAVDDIWSGLKLMIRRSDR